MRKLLQVVGVILLVGVIVFGILYLLSATGIASKANPGSLFGDLIRGFQDALNGIQASIARMFGNFTR